MTASELTPLRKLLSDVQSVAAKGQGAGGGAPFNLGRPIPGIAPPVWLPKSDEGLARLRQVMATHRLPGGLEAVKADAWSLVLQHPKQTLRLGSPTTDDLAKFECPWDLGECVHVTVAVVLRAAAGRTGIEPEVAAVPVAGLANLLVRVAGGSRDALDVAADVMWSETTDPFWDGLARAWRLAGRPKVAGKPLRVVLLTDEALHTQSVDQERITDLAAVAGVELTIASGRDTAVARQVRDTPPTAMIVAETLLLAAPSDPVAGYITAATNPQLFSWRPTSGERGLAVILREIVGIGQGLVPVARVHANDARQRVNYERGSSWYSSRFGRITRDGSHAVSVDLDGHGQSAYKQFAIEAKGLRWVADLDASKNVIVNKHKGPTGLFIPWKNLAAI